MNLLFMANYLMQGLVFAVQLVSFICLASVSLHAKKGGLKNMHSQNKSLRGAGSIGIRRITIKWSTFRQTSPIFSILVEFYVFNWSHITLKYALDYSIQGGKCNYRRLVRTSNSSESFNKFCVFSLSLDVMMREKPIYYNCEPYPLTARLYFVCITPTVLCHLYSFCWLLGIWFMRVHAANLFDCLQGRKFDLPTIKKFYFSCGAFENLLISRHLCSCWYLFVVIYHHCDIICTLLPNRQLNFIGCFLFIYIIFNSPACVVTTESRYEMVRSCLKRLVCA